MDAACIQAKFKGRERGRKRNSKDARHTFSNLCTFEIECCS